MEKINKKLFWFVFRQMKQFLFFLRIRIAVTKAIKLP